MAINVVSAKSNIVTVLATLLLASGVAFLIRASDSSLDSATAIIPCTGTGGLAKYAYCNWQEPTSNAGSGIQITKIAYMVGKSPVPVGVDITIGNSETASGHTAVTPLTDIATSTGASFVYSTGALLVTEGNYIRAVTLTNPTSTHTATMLIEYVTRLTY